MKTRLIAGIVAVLLAAAGSVLLVSYVRGADARAMAGLDTVNVLVAADPIPKGTKAADLAALVDTRQLPRNAVLDGGVTSLDQLAGEIATVPLSAGEQLLDSKFGQPASTNTGPTIPPELQQVSVLLDRQRALGGQIKAGDSVGVFLSAKDPDRTHLEAHKVLVARVEQAAPANASGATPASSTSDGNAQQAPADLTDSLLVSLATDAPTAEKIVFAATYGSVWLSNEPTGADENGTQVIDGTKVYQ
jgi:pilus assembly protein CpaB